LRFSENCRAPFARQLLTQFDNLASDTTPVAPHSAVIRARAVPSTERLLNLA